MTKEQALETVFNSMPDQFTSNLFCNEIRKLGVSQNDINAGITSNYLSKRVKKLTLRTYVKKHKFDTTSKPNNDFNIVVAIEGLKKLGYKILKPSYTEI